MKKNSAQESSRFNRVLVFDINPGNDDVSKDLIIGRLARVVKNASIYQFIVLTGHSNLVLLKKMASDIGVKNGYIVSDSGARVYSIMDDKIIFEKPMAKEDVKICVHAGVVSNYLTLASSTSKEYAYSLNVLNAVTLNKRHYLPLSFTNEYPRFEKFVGTNQIYSILYYMKDMSSNDEKRDVFKLIQSNSNISIYYSQNDYFSVTTKSVSKFNAILKIMEECEIIGMNNVHYFGLNVIDDDCFNAFKNKSINMDAAIRSSFYVSKIENHVDLNGLIEAIQSATNIASTDDFSISAVFGKKTINKKNIKKAL